MFLERIEMEQKMTKRRNAGLTTFEWIRGTVLIVSFLTLSVCLALTDPAWDGVGGKLLFVGVIAFSSFYSFFVELCIE